MTWTRLDGPATASAQGPRDTGTVLTDVQVFEDFHRLQRGGPPPEHAAQRFASALAAVQSESESPQPANGEV
ncbi:MAG TPA: hypothetical protein H9793_05060 [Candidatus Brevibacterium intestinigallinarum]|nr:hypothetical protein [Candidatus Brevibacterium intestinigallinarum]